MPEIKIDRIVSISSEDTKYPAKNLLGPPGSGKWKTSTSGEKKASVIFQFNKPQKVTSIHVGNESSAFVEVLVGKESESDQDWKVILVASSLMTPADARSNTNTQRVRLFGQEALSKATVEEKWDRAKVVCTQPFNKSIAYGLSFISFLSNDGDDSQKDDTSIGGSQKLGAYTLNDSDEDDELSSSTKGAVFTERARLQADIPPPTAAAAVRAAAREADHKTSVQSSTKKADTQKEAAKSKADSPRSTKRDERSKQEVKRSQTKTEKTPEKPKETEKSKQSKHERPDSSSGATGEASRKTDAAIPFKKLMSNVVFALSGFKNPKRSDLREKAIEMGAKYRPDWDKTCTHLICAYNNTPKFSQVNGKGYIVNEDWILDSHKRKSLQSWRKYRLDRSKTPPLEQKNTSDKNESKDKAEKSADKESKKDESITPKKEDNTSRKDTKRVYEDSTDVDSDVEATKQPSKKKVKRPEQESQDSDATEVDSMDTDDEIAAHIAKTNSPDKGKSPANGKASPVKASASNEPINKPTGSLPILPDFLLDKTFFLYGTVNNRRDVYRYILAYGGQVEEYMSDDVNYVITDDPWDDNFDSALTDNPNLIFVKSKWINDIHEKQKFLPHQKYVVVPQ